VRELASLGVDNEPQRGGPKMYGMLYYCFDEQLLRDDGDDDGDDDYDDVEDRMTPLYQNQQEENM
jgi:hypothetical protein